MNTNYLLNIFSDFDPFHYKRFYAHHIPHESLSAEFCFRLNVLIFLGLQRLYTCTQLDECK